MAIPIKGEVSVIAGRVTHVRPCEDCDGAGSYVTCAWHGNGCDCGGHLYDCDTCDGDGSTRDENCNCEDCVTLWELNERQGKPMTNEEACREIEALLGRLNKAIDRSQALLADRPPTPVDAQGWGEVMDALEECSKKEISKMVKSKTALEMAMCALLAFPRPSIPKEAETNG